jgi:hypothetical protein
LFANGKFGVTWKLFQCVVKPRETLSGKCHIELNDTDRSKLEVASDNEDDELNVATKEATKEATKVEDSDDEDDPVVEPEVEPVVEPDPVVEEKKVESDDLIEKPKKKIVKKVKKPVAAAEE